jgi:hypothetical protein
MTGALCITAKGRGRMMPMLTLRSAESWTPAALRRLTIRYLIAAVTAAGWNWAASRPVLAQDYPTRMIKILTNSSASGTYDIFARALASELNNHWDQPVIVEPRPGGNFMIAGRACAEFCTRFRPPAVYRTSDQRQ